MKMLLPAVASIFVCKIEAIFIHSSSQDELNRMLNVRKLSID